MSFRQPPSVDKGVGCRFSVPAADKSPGRSLYAHERADGLPDPLGRGLDHPVAENRRDSSVLEMP